MSPVLKGEDAPVGQRGEQWSDLKKQIFNIKLFKLQQECTSDDGLMSI